MSNQPKNKDRHRTRAKAIRFTEQNETILQKYQNDYGLNLTDAINRIVEQFSLHGHEPEEKSLEFQKCDSHSEIPAHYGKFVNCKKKGITITEEKCQLCWYYETNKVTLMTKKRLEKCNAKLKEENQDLQNLKQTLTAEVQELDANTRTGLLKQIKSLTEHVKTANELIVEKNTYIGKLHGKIEDKNAYIDYVKCSIEPTVNFHNVEGAIKDKEPLQTSQQIPEKAIESQPLVERITEKEKEKITEKFREPQQPQEPKISEDLQIKCPDTKKPVSFKEVCSKTCKKFAICPTYLETFKEIRMRNKVLGNHEEN